MTSHKHVLNELILVEIPMSIHRHTGNNCVYKCLTNRIVSDEHVTTIDTVTVGWNKDMDIGRCMFLDDILKFNIHVCNHDICICVKNPFNFGVLLHNLPNHKDFSPTHRNVGVWNGWLRFSHHWLPGDRSPTITCVV